MRYFRLRSLVAFLTAGCGIPWASAADVLDFTVTRSNLPALTYYDLTLRVDACGATNANVMADDRAVQSRLENGRVIFTTAGTNISVVLNGVTDRTRLGGFSKAVLKDDRLWAWSNGFDDNKMFKSTALPLLEKYDYRATVFLIGSILNDTRNEGWITDKPDVVRLVKKGWGIGNHSWNHTVVPAEKGAANTKWGTPGWAPTPDDMAKAKESVRQTYKYLRAACDEAGRSDYRLIAFAAPMFDSRWAPVIADMVKAKDSEVLFNESGNRALVVVDPGWTAAGSRNGLSGFDPAVSIGRDWAIQVFGTGAKDDPKQKLVTEIAKCGESYHVWYNTLCHGVDAKHGIMAFVPWVHDTYGQGGSKTVWVAPSDEIYSYLLVRDHATVTLNGCLPLAMSASNLCAWIQARTAIPARTLTSMKGWELYIWQDQGKTFYALLTGTNRLKTQDEIAHAAISSLDDLERQLDALVPGQTVSVSGRVLGSAAPGETLKSVAAYGKQIGLIIEGQR